MSRYKKSLEVMLEKESVRVCVYLNDNNLEATKENIEAFYKSINKTVNKNGIKQMFKYLNLPKL